MITPALAAIALLGSPSPSISAVWKAAKQAGFSGGIIVVSGDQTLLLDVNNPTKLKAVQLSPKTLFPVCSITKGLTAQAVLGLVNRGKLNLDEKVSTYLSWLPSFAGKPTIRQLLTHTSGLANMNDALTKDPDGISSIYRSADRSLEPLKARILKILGEKPIAEPGAAYDYSNTDFLILQAVIEQVTGKPLEAELEAQIFTPAGLQATRFPTWNEAPQKYADCYGRVGTTDSILKPFNIAVYGAGGGLLSNAEDLSRWMKFTLNSPIGKQWLNSGSQYGGFQGLGNYAIDPTEGDAPSAFRPVVERPGAINGYTLQVSFLPKQRLAVAAFSNKAGEQLGSVFQGSGLVFDLLRVVLEDRRTETARR